MEWTEATQEYIRALKPVHENVALRRRVLSLIDLTRLQANDTEANMAAFLQKAQTPLGHVAAVCVYPQFARLAADEFANTPVKVATVANFPEGDAALDEVLLEMGGALREGVQEMDVVFPYARYLAGEKQYAQNFVVACKAACGEEVKLKVILETGALSDPVIIADAAYEMLAAGADFIKTSTGKLSQGATLEAAAILLLVIRHARTQLKREAGLKVSGGIHEVQQAAQYIELADLIMGHKWVTPATFRIGTSKLLDEILQEM